MAEIRRITCDGCGADVTEVNGTAYHRLELESRPRRTNRDNAMGSVCSKPLVGRVYHFCGVACLKLWAAEGEDQS